MPATRCSRRGRTPVDALFEARLTDMGVRHLVAVRGPAQAGYQGREIGNSKLARTLMAWLADETETDADTRVIVAAHSSGSFVAHELFGQLTTGLDPDGLTADRIWSARRWRSLRTTRAATSAPAGACTTRSSTRARTPTTFALQADYTDFADAGIGRAVAVEYLDRASWE